MVILSFKEALFFGLEFTNEYMWIECDNCNNVRLLKLKNITIKGGISSRFKYCHCNKPQIRAINCYKTTLICA